MTDLERCLSEYVSGKNIKDDIENFQQLLKRVFITGYASGVSYQSKQAEDDCWHIRTEDGWTNWGNKNPPCDQDLIVTVLDSSGDYDTYDTVSAWYHGGLWISKDDGVQGDVVAWKYFPKPCKI